MAAGEKDNQGEKEPSGHLSDDEMEKVAEKKAESARVVHEAIRLQGQGELDRPILSLLLSAFAAGVGMSASVLAGWAFSRFGRKIGFWTQVAERASGGGRRR